VPARELGRRGEGGRVEPAAGAAVRKRVRIADPVRPLGSIPQIRIEVRALRNRNRVTRLRPDQPRDSPARYLPDPRNLIDPARGKNFRNIAVRKITLQMAVETI